MKILYWQHLNEKPERNDTINILYNIYDFQYIKLKSASLASSLLSGQSSSVSGLFVIILNSTYKSYKLYSMLYKSSEMVMNFSSI